jgi:RNA polymerase sigma factor (sigma-70 family)
MATAQLDMLLRHIRQLAARGCTVQRSDRQLLDDFSASRDEAAFSTLVARHGPMVLRVCRRVLHHEQDAEDSFQATFLVLAQHTASIRKPEALAEWLHGVAYRTAMEAKRKAARRRYHEAQVRNAPPKTAASPTWDDVQAVLDEEIQRLPKAFRSVFVLCALEGKSGPEAAAVLGIQPGTVSSRLVRARQRLQQRLTRRGIELSALLAALAVTENAGTAAVPALLASVTVRSGLLVAAGGTAAGVIPAHVAKLAAGVTKAMFLTQAKITTMIVLTASLLASGAGVITHQALAGKPVAAQAPEIKPPGRKPNQLAAKQEISKTDVVAIKEQAQEKLAYSGRVLAPDGHPVAGAKLYMTRDWGYPHYPSPSPEFATTGADGRFQFKASKAEFDDQFTVVAAAAAKYGVGWVNIPAGGKREDLTIQLVADDLPITGQIVDLQGKPVPGATLTVMQINAAPGDDLAPWLEAAKAKKGLSYQIEHKYLSRYTIAVPLQVTTDADGRFRLAGIGPNRLVEAQLDGPTVTSEHLHMLTRSGEAITITEYEGNPEYGDPRRVATYYGASFRHVAAPTKPIVGVVRDKDTKKPLAGVTVRSLHLTIRPGFWRSFDLVRTTTDAHGRYRLTGMPTRAGNFIVAIPHSDLPYIATNKETPDSPGLDPVTVDMELARGVWIEGKITDKVTGQPIQGLVEYFSLYSNPRLNEYPGFDGTILDVTGELRVRAKEDGSYRIVGLPGPGLVVVAHGVRHRGDQYLSAPERDDEFGTKEPSMRTSPYHLSFTSNYAAIARVDPHKGVDSVKRDITLDPGWSFTGTLLGPDGKPLSGARRFGWGHEVLKTAEFTIRPFDPLRRRDIHFQHLEKGLVGVAHAPKKNGDSVIVRMEPGAVITGRLVDKDGSAQAGVELEVAYRQKGEPYWGPYSPSALQTDQEGRFRLEALMPGYEFRLSYRKVQLDVRDVPALGRTKDLGDVLLKTKAD